MKKLIFLGSGFLFLSIILAIWVNMLKPVSHALIPTLTGEVEYCLTCHSKLPEISKSHPVETFGCISCHGGERLALDADLAHSSMRGERNPSDFSVVETSCGGEKCHSGMLQGSRDHIPRVLTSIQATYAGAIASMRFTFGAQPDQTARFGIFSIVDQNFSNGDSGVPLLEEFVPEEEVSPALQSFGKNCMNCHLSAIPPELSSDLSYHRLTGCAACHTPSANIELDQPLHRLTTALSYTQCNTCHNRGNYDLRTIHFQERQDNPANRQEDYYQPIAQFTRCEWTLDCIDCHTRQETMGDGHIYSSKKQIQNVRCYSCHGTLTRLPSTQTIRDSGDLALLLAFINPVIDIKLGDTIQVSEKGEPFWNVRLLPNGVYELFGKASGQRFTFRPVMGTNCQQKLDQQESRYCHECHAIEQ